MKVQDTVRKATMMIAAGVVVLSVIMVIAFVCLGQYNYTVLLGAILGSVFSVLNFFLMGLSVQQAAASMENVTVPVKNEDENEEQTEEKDKIQKPVTQEGKAVRKRMQISYTARMAMLVAVALLALCVPVFHPVATVLPMLFPRIVISFQGFFNKEAT